MIADLKNLLLLALLCMVHCVAWAQGEIYGTLRTVEGLPVPDAIVKVISSNNRVAGSASEEDGVYSVKPISPGSYTLQISKDGYISITVKNIPLSPMVSMLINRTLICGTGTTTVDYIPPVIPVCRGGGIAIEVDTSSIQDICRLMNPLSFTDWRLPVGKPELKIVPPQIEVFPEPASIRMIKDSPKLRAFTSDHPDLWNMPVECYLRSRVGAKKQIQ